MGWLIFYFIFTWLFMAGFLFEGENFKELDINDKWALAITFVFAPVIFPFMLGINLYHIFRDYSD